MRRSELLCHFLRGKRFDNDNDNDEVHRWVGCLRQRKREGSGEGWSVGG